MRLFFIVLFCLVFSGCATQRPATQDAETQIQQSRNPYDIDMKNIDETADISARLQWCGFDYEPFYLTSMQFERLDANKTQMQLAQLGYMHGAMLTKRAKSLESSKCESQSLETLRLDHDANLRELCSRQNERENLKKQCSDAAKVLR